MKYYYEKNDYLLTSEVNKTFEEILWMKTEDFLYWCKKLREEVVYSWDILGIPPRVGYNENEIIDQFQQMESFPIHKFQVKDELTGEKDVIRNTHTLGNAVNQWFPSMMKTRINYTDDSENGKSIYDFFYQDELFDRFVTYATRHFKRDSFYHYSNPILIGDKQYGHDLPFESDSIKWIQKFEQNEYRKREFYDYWLAPISGKDYTGYNPNLKGKQYLSLSKNDIENNIDLIPEKCRTNVDWNKSEVYQIRIFKLGQKLFPIGFKAFRVSFCQYAVNFPPLTAKFLWDKFTDQWKDEPTIYVWDPSAGWGGRLLGAMSIKDNRHVTYLANDPNTDHNILNGDTKYHDIYKFYIKNINKGGLFPSEHTDFKFWQLGSEVMQYDTAFQKYKGKISVVFTSPPYFAKEAYSEDPEQSYKKFSSYEIWKKRFLYETLKTAYEWLRPNGFLLWNIADVKFGNMMLPLEYDSQEICKALGFQYVQTLKMALAQMPGGNRIDTETGLPKAKNFIKVNGMFLKYEPIFIFQKHK